VEFDYFVMRASLSFFLAIMLSLNAAYTASVGVCGAMEHSTSHAEHFGHHQHHHSDDHDHGHDDQSANADESVSDHHHNHVHPGFSTILPDSIGIAPLIDGSITVANLTETFVSAPPTLLERPPRNTLA
jgi:ABC-type Zn2+ transport system substrate-binding protein/surface adhesin